MITFYRGDSRTPQQIAEPGGFRLWPESQRIVAAAGGVDAWIYHNLFLGNKNNRDIQRYIVAGKNRARPTISTSKNQGCGGYDSGYIYKIDFTENDLKISTFGPGQMSFPTTHDIIMLGNNIMEFLLDSDRLKTANVIGLDLKIATAEVVFFTIIPLVNITAYRDSRNSGSTFLPMP